MGNQQPTGRTRSDTYTRYERDGEDGRYVTLDQTDSSGNNHLSSVDERVRSLGINTIDCFSSRRSLFGKIQVYQFVFVINGKCNNIILNKRFKQKCRMRRRRFLSCLNIQLHQEIKKLY